MAVALASIVALARTLAVRLERPRLYMIAAVATAIDVALVLLVGTTSLGATGTLAAVAMLLLAPVAVSIAVWVRTVGEDG